SLATIKLLEEKYMANAKRIGDFILKRTEAWTSKFKTLAEVRGRGLMIGIEFVKDQKTKEKNPELRNRLVQAAFHKGLLLLGSGDTTMRFCPPLVIDEEQAEFAVKTLEDCIREEEKKR